ncbi:high-affinity nicotinic acid transporter [[Candida] anglica]|uniref:High-affinity nicotinic acid transporter n=1 Tax=[Candida] anglica TaxID=148631 RepID=A0ABP0EG63_9ASCO
MSEKNRELVTIESLDNEDEEIVTIDLAQESKLVHKLDRTVLPILGLLYFMAALDRSNIGNSAAAGLQEAIGLTAAQLSNCVSLFYVTYIISEIPATLLLRKFKPHRFLAALGFMWGLVTIGTTFVSGYSSLLVCRLLLGLFEGGYFPCIMVYVSIFYKPEEQALRMGYLLSCAGAAGAFGGLISYGLVQVNSTNPYLQGYRLIYLVEGLITICTIPIVYFYLPDDENVKFFNEAEHEIMRLRTIQRKQYMGNSKFEWIEIRKAFSDPKTYFSMFIQFFSDIVLYGFSTFLPSILRSGLGYSITQAQYLTIPVYISAIISTLCTSRASDYLKIRGPFIAGANVSAAIGYIILLTANNNAVKYFATYLIALSLYVHAGINLAWTANNSSPYYRRTCSIGSNQALGNISGAIAGQIYRKSPYLLGHSFSLGCVCASTICVVLNTLWLQRQNRVKQKILCGERTDKMKERTGDHNLDFKYCY